MIVFVLSISAWWIGAVGLMKYVFQAEDKALPVKDAYQLAAEREVDSLLSGCQP